MGLPWCLAAMTPAIAGTLADPSNGGTPAVALRWIFLTIPAALVAAAFLGTRQRREAHVEGR